MSIPKSKVSFPREFKKSGIEQIDWKLVSFGSVVFIIIFGGISIFASLPEPEVDLERIAEMQKRVAQIAMPDAPPTPPPEIETPVEEVEIAEVPEEIPEVVDAAPAPRQSRADQRATSGGGGGGGGGQASRAESRARRGQARAAAAQALAQQGVWAQLATKGGSGSEVAFGGNTADLETSLGQVGGVKRGGTSTFDGTGSGAGVGEGAVVGPAGGRSSRGGSGDGMDVGSLLGGGVGGGGATSLGGDGAGPGGDVDIDLNAIAGAGGRGPVDEARSDAAVLQVLRQNLGPVRFCYQRELKLNPNLQGSLQLKLTIAANGRVTRTEVVNDAVGSRNLVRCVQGRIRSWRFQPAKSNSVVTITLPFSPNA